MKFGLVLTNDWELFGNGSGDYWNIQHHPLERLLQTVGNHGAPLTVMAEVGQQWAFQQLGEREAWASEISMGWEKILQHTVRDGSDVQLHLHPQWLNARYENNRWVLGDADWALSSLSPDRMGQTLVRGKQYLDSLLRPVNPDYACVAFRAGAYCLMPSKVVIQKLLAADLLCDTSVTRGLYESERYDFRQAYSHYQPWYATPDNITQAAAEPAGLLEFPICSCAVNDSAVLRKLLGEQMYNKLRFGIRTTYDEQSWLAKNKEILQRRYPLSNRPGRNRGTGRGRGIGWFAAKIFGRRIIQLDYDNLSPGMFVHCLRSVAGNAKLSRKFDEQTIIPVIASGHVKTMHNTDNVNRILAAVRREFAEQLEYWTLRELIQHWRAQNCPDQPAKVVDSTA